MLEGSGTPSQSNNVKAVKRIEMEASEVQWWCVQAHLCNDFFGHLHGVGFEFDFSSLS